MKSLFVNLILVTILTFSGCAQTQNSSGGTRQDVNATQAKELITKEEELVILDVRTPEEFANGHVANAKNLDFYAPDFEQQLEQLDTTKPYLIYCASGNRSGKTATLMQNKGFKKIINSQTGFQELKQAAVPTK
ncbi:rhodanese-like domain-containing protein [Adhaeribacter terreus]|uniref:Rhodanese-like domain-containing protein n=1 Tax=Adhaeribacter terreus TaxID=529703 RepID=A0ABW0E8F6_9BACT